jgi:hypothetical protein
MLTFTGDGRQARVVILICLVLFVALVSASALFSQTASTGALTGTLRDSSGAVVPGATVTLTNLGTNQVRVATTDASGTYNVGLLPAGVYSVRFASAGFNTADVPSVSIVVTETAVLDHVLEVGAQTQEVEVRAEAEAVQTATTTVGTVVNSETLTSMPLTSRNYTNLLGLSAGAAANVFNAANLGRGTQDISVNGSSIAQNNFQMDGASIVNWTGNGNAADSGANPGIGIVNPDAIEEFKIQTSMFDAGYGRKPGASVNVVTKSGTNQFHGTAFEFFRNTALNANDFFRKMNAPVNGVAQNGRPVLNQNQYGGTLGGPVKKNRLFFFASYQETQQKNGLSPAGISNPVLVNIPKEDRSTAQFVADLGQAWAGKAGQQGGVKVAPNGSNINPVALALLRLKNADGSYFIPSTDSSTGANQTHIFSIPATYSEHQAVGNFDYVLNDRNTLSGRWTYEQDLTNAPMGCGATGTTITQCLPGAGGLVRFPVTYIVGRLTTSLSNSLVNEARISLQRYVIDVANLGSFTDTGVGIDPAVPSINFLNNTTINGLMKFGAQLALASEKQNTSWEVADQISWSHARHTIRTGFEYERDRQNWQFPGPAITNMTFSSFPDFLLGLPGCSPALTQAACTASQASNVSAPLPGQTNGTFFSNIANTGTTVGLTGPFGVIHAFRAPSASAFVQDDFKFSNSITLNLGLRWEYNGLNYDKYGKNTNVWPNLVALVPNSQLGTSPATGTLAGFVVPSNYQPQNNPVPPVGGVFQTNSKINTQNSPSFHNFGPRVGVAWKPLPTDRFVTRAGFGMFFDRAGNTIYNKSAVQGLPYDRIISQSNQANWFSTEAEPFCIQPTPGVPCTAPTLSWGPRWFNPATSTGSALSVISTGPLYLQPITYEWNLNAQYEFLRQWVLELGYVGSRGTHQVPDATVNQILEHQINQPLLASAANPVNGQTTNTSANAALRLPYLGFSPAGLGVDQTISDSKFNSLQATVRKQLSHGLQLQATYTYARGFTTASYINFNDASLPLQYGLMPYIRPQRFTINYSWDLPFGTHEGLVGKVVNGWNVAGVTVAQDGSPLTVTDSNGGSIYAKVNTSTAVFAPGMGAANVATPGGVEQRLGGSVLGGPGYLNKAAFLPFGTGSTPYGTAGYGIILGPGQFNFDATIQKTTKVGGIHEDATLVFRTEFFNAFNHAQFSNPVSVDVNNSSFGQITSSAVNPRLIQFALKYVF